MFGGVKDVPVYVESVRTVPAWEKWSSVTPRKGAGKHVAGCQGVYSACYQVDAGHVIPPHAAWCYGLLAPQTTHHGENHMAHDLVFLNGKHAMFMV
jgi:hypothetical protein